MHVQALTSWLAADYWGDSQRRKMGGGDGHTTL